MPKDIIWRPSQDIIKNSKLTKFINFCKAKNYDDLENKSYNNPGWLWDNVIKFSDLKFFKNYEKIMDDAKGAPWTRWCIGGTTNIVLNCFDRHKGKEFFNQTFIFSEKKMEKQILLRMQNLTRKYQK